MGEYCSLFAGIVKDHTELQEFFVEYDEEFAEDELEDDDCDLDVDKPTCKAGELFGFGWYDHDWISYAIADKTMSLDEFFNDEASDIISSWDVKDKEQVKALCKKLKIEKLNFVFHFGEENFSELKVGQKVKTENGYLQFLGYLSKDGKRR